MKENYFKALTGVRVIAAYMVFIHHKNPFDENFFGTSIFDFFREFHIGVTIFFVLSGFLIAYRYFEEENINFKYYLVKRFARIYPVYFVLTTVTFLGYAIYYSKLDMNNLGLYFFNITFLRGFFDDLKFTGIAQGWSLTVEECFYFLAPLFFIFIKKSKIYLLIIPIFFLVMGFGIAYFFSKLNFYGFMKNSNFMLGFTFFGRVTEFIIGISLALVVTKINKSKFKYFTLIGCIVILFFVYSLSVLKVGNGSGTDCVLGKLINTLLLPIFGIAPLFYGLIFEKTILSRVLETKIFVLLGKSSYIFYLIHMGIFAVALNKISHNLLFLFIGLNCISILMFKYIELPFNLFIRHRILKEQTKNLSIVSLFFLNQKKSK
nr:acyltransferase [uncultured Flavobacterium sp.]